jgi:diaminopimelate epimerase
VGVKRLQKWHGAGNDFLVDIVTGPHSWTAENVMAVCRRHTGMGADGLLVARLGTPVEMTLFNADGTQAEMSGNGIRCLAAAVFRHGPAFESLEVQTAAGRRTVSLTMVGDEGSGSVAMGRATAGSSIEGALAVMSVGNPHVVVLDDKAMSTVERERRAEELATQVGGANVEFITVESSNRLSMKVLERGVGWTLACGTGSVAAAFAAVAAGLVRFPVTVANPGGDLLVDEKEGEAILSGPMAFIGDVEWTEA